jgi:hypothetical protein
MQFEKAFFSRVNAQNKALLAKKDSNIRIIIIQEQQGLKAAPFL